MKSNRKLAISLIVSALFIPVVLIGCDREVSSSKQSTVNADGSSKTKATTVTQSPNGAVTKEETATTTPPTKP